jgi:hypothetical protein
MKFAESVIWIRLLSKRNYSNTSLKGVNEFIPAISTFIEWLWKKIDIEFYIISLSTTEVRKKWRCDMYALVTRVNETLHVFSTFLVLFE